jgi:GNAT superfamily N-acetyltransferase
MRSPVTALGSPSIATLRALHWLRVAVDAEAEQPAPGVTSATFADLASTIRQPPHGARIDHFIARTERSALAGWATLTIRDDASLQGVGKFNIEVPARMRRGGVGTALLDAIRTQARLYEVTNLYAWAPIGTAGAGFLANGLDRPRSEEVWSVLDLQRSPAPVVASRDDLEARRWSGPCTADMGWLCDYRECRR